MVTSRDPWCPGGVGPRCPCPGAGLAYPMRSHVPPNASFVGTSNFACYAPSESARCTPTGFAAATRTDGTISNGSTCLPDADIKWTPEAWESEDIVPRLPRNVSVRQLQRACRKVAGLPPLSGADMDNALCKMKIDDFPSPSNPDVGCITAKQARKWVRGQQRILCWSRGHSILDYLD